MLYTKYFQIRSNTAMMVFNLKREGGGQLKIYHSFCRLMIYFTRVENNVRKKKLQLISSAVHTTGTYCVPN